MQVIWKRPDGFQNASPEDFVRVELSNGAHLWLHRHERDWYPFQVSGDWSGQTDTKRLNRLVNMIEADTSSWELFLEHAFDDSLEVQKNLSLITIAQENLEWLKTFEKSIKGHTWEVEIVRCVLFDVMEKLKTFCV
jgi:hypothetical protein